MTNILRWAVTTALIVGCVTIVSAIRDEYLGEMRARVLLSLAVVVLGGSLLVVDIVFPAGKRQRKIGWGATLATTVAAVLSFVLIWSPPDLFTNRYLWKAWWFFSALSVSSAHVLALLRARTTPRGWLILRNVTIVAAVGFAAILIGMTFQTDVFALPGQVLTTCLVVFGVIQITGSLVLLKWGRPNPPKRRVPAKVLRMTWKVALPLLIFATGFYFGRKLAPPPGAAQLSNMLLASQSSEAIDEEVRDDLEFLRDAVDGVEGLRTKARKLREDLTERRKAKPDLRLTPTEEDKVHALFFSYLGYRTALLRMVALYSGFEGVKNIAQRDRCFLVGYAAGTLCYSVSLELVNTYRYDDLVRDKLNEGDLSWQIPDGMFNEIEASIALKQNVRVFQEMAAYFEHHSARWRDCGFENEDLRFLQDVIEHAAGSIRTNPLFGKPVPLASVLAEVRDDAYTPVYAIQSIVSTWIGDTRLVARAACISHAQVQELRKHLQPGDIILERRNWYLSNAFLPGFWPHAAFYIGTLADLERLGIAEDPIIQGKLPEYLALGHDGEHKVVIEAISEGVSFTTLSEATRADYIAVLRPRLTDAQKAAAIKLAFGYHGKPYDFEFDFSTAGKIVCTELVQRSYNEMIEFPTQPIMGKDAVPALLMAKMYRDEKDTPGQQVDFVVFLDTPEGQKNAVFRFDDAEFIKSIDRPRAFNE